MFDFRNAASPGRARFVLLGALVVAAILFGPDLLDRLRGTSSDTAPTGLQSELWVPTAHSAVLLVDYPTGQIDVLNDRIAELPQVVGVNLRTHSDATRDAPFVYGTIRLDGLRLRWNSQEPLAGFTGTVRAFRASTAPEPDPQAIDAALMALEQLILRLEGGNALFITDEEMRASN